MTVTFKSRVEGQGDNENRIEFTAPVVITERNGMTSYEFKEPSNGIMNNIEVAENNVNIFAGPSTISMEKGLKILNEYMTPQGTFTFDAELNELNIKENHIQFNYNLSQIGKEFGTFFIELKINK